MRAPSTDLLRALRQATRPISSGVHAPQSQKCFHHHSTSKLTHSFRQHVHIQVSSSLRTLSTSRSLLFPSSSPPAAAPASARDRGSINPHAPPKNRSRGPASSEKTQTDFQAMDIYASAGIEEPATSIDASLPDGFHLNNGVQTSGGRGVMLLGGEGFVWSPWNYLDVSTTRAEVDVTQEQRNAGAISRFTDFLDARSTLNFPSQSLGLLTFLYPKPDLLIFGTGRYLHMLSKETRRYLSEELGMKVDVMDTANAAAAYNLLVMERGFEGVGAILIPEGFVGKQRGR